MAKLQCPVYISNNSNGDIILMITQFQVSIAITVSSNFFIYFCLKLMLVFHISCKQILIIEKMICCSRIDNNRDDKRVLRA